MRFANSSGSTQRRFSRPQRAQTRTTAPARSRTPQWCPGGIRRTQRIARVRLGAVGVSSSRASSSSSRASAFPGESSTVRARRLIAADQSPRAYARTPAAPSLAAARSASRRSNAFGRSSRSYRYACSRWYPAISSYSARRSPACPPSLAHEVEEPVEHAAGGLGFHALDERGRADDVGEDDGSLSSAACAKDYEPADSGASGRPLPRLPACPRSSFRIAETRSAAYRRRDELPSLSPCSGTSWMPPSPWAECSS